MTSTKTSLMAIVSFVTSMDIKLLFVMHSQEILITHNNHDKSRFDYGRRHDRTIHNNVNNSYNIFDVLSFEIECYMCNNFGHVSRKCPMNFQKSAESNYTNLKN